MNEGIHLDLDTWIVPGPAVLIIIIIIEAAVLTGVIAIKGPGNLLLPYFGIAVT